MSDENTLNRLLKNIESLGERYCEEILLKDWKKETLESDWWEALKFFFGRSFFRGRRDELSNEYQSFTIEVLKKYFSISSENVDKSYEKLQASKGLFSKDLILAFKNAIRTSGTRTKGSIIKHSNFDKEVASKNPLVKILSTRKEVAIKWKKKTYQKEVRLGNEEDIMMVLDVLKLVSDAKNIYEYLKETIRDSGAKKAYNELEGVRAISHKLASFIIRDIGLLNPEIIKDKDYEYAFPVDTWVSKVSTRLEDDIPNIKKFFIEKCIGRSISPLKLAAGLWYLGFNSLDLALEYLDEVEINAKR